LTPFAVTYGGKSIWSPALNPETSKIRYAVEFEWLEAAHFWGYEWQIFDALESETQALLIAHWRTTQRMIAVEREQDRLRQHGTRRTTTRRRGR